MIAVTDGERAAVRGEQPGDAAQRDLAGLRLLGGGDGARAAARLADGIGLQERSLPTRMLRLPQHEGTTVAVCVRYSRDGLAHLARSDGPGARPEHGETAVRGVRARRRAVSRQLATDAAGAGAVGHDAVQARALGVLGRHGRCRLGELVRPPADRPALGHRGGRHAGRRAASSSAAPIRPTAAPPSSRSPTRGTEVMSAIRTARAAEADDFFARLDEADRAALSEILRKLRA